MDNHAHHQVGLFASSAGTAVLWTIDQLRQHGPSWSLVPPIFVALAGLVGAINGAVNDRHRRRVELAKLSARSKTGFSFDQLEARGN